MLCFSPPRALVALLLFVGGAASSQALQLGESQAQILARHGVPAVEDHAKQLAMYYWTGWSARLEFRSGVVEKLIYKKNDYLNASDIASLLQANGGANRWRESTPPGAEARQWTRDDGAVASCDAAHAIAMVFQSRQEALATFQQLGAEPKSTPPSDAPSVPATPAPAPQFFPDPLATPALRDPKLSEISIPPEPSDSVKAPRLKVKDARPQAPISAPASESSSTSASPGHPPSRGETPAPIDPPAQIEPPPAPSVPLAAISSAPQSPPTPAPAVVESGDGFVRIVALGSLICGVTGALILLYKSIPRRRVRESVAIDAVPELPKSAGVDVLRWEQVELLVGEIYRRVGYTAEISAGLGTENGIDLTLRRNTETVLVQCKHWKTLRVTEREMREFYGAIASSGSPLGIFVSMGGITRGAREFAADKGIDLIDRKTLEERMEGVVHPGENLCIISEWIEEFAAHSRIFDPECPVCRQPMDLRRNAAGDSAFWGCRDYPRCSGKREMRRDLHKLLPARPPSKVISAL